MNSAILILASGSGSRYDGIKQLADIEGQPMLGRVTTAACAASDNVVVVLGAFADQISQTLAHLECDIVLNEDWPSGLSSSIRAGVKFIEETYPATTNILITLGDLPHVTVEHYRTLLEAADKETGRLVASLYHGVVGVPAVFPSSSSEQLKSLSGDKGARAILRDHEDILVVDLPEAGRDIDTLSDH